MREVRGVKPTCCGYWAGRSWPGMWRALLLCAGLLLLACGAAACTQGDQATDAEGRAQSTSTPTPSTAAVRPVALMETGGPIIPGSVSLSDEAISFEPPAQLPLYEIDPREPVDRESMDALATRLGFGQDRQYTEEGLSGSKGSLVFPRADDASCFRLVNSATIDAAFGAILADKPPQPPSPEETEAIADAYLESLGMKEELVFVGTYEATAYGTATLDGKQERWVVEMGARYRALLDGVPLVGAGAKVTVGVDYHGDVVEFYHFVQKATLTKQVVTIRSIEAALADLRAGKGELPPDINPERAESVAIERIELCYYASPAVRGEKYYKPVYVFHVRLSDGTVGDWNVSAFEGSNADGAI
jgi:hypothetical protein